MYFLKKWEDNLPSLNLTATKFRQQLDSVKGDYFSTTSLNKRNKGASFKYCPSEKHNLNI